MVKQMGRKYNAPEDIKKWCPIISQEIKLDCKYIVQSKCLFGCTREEAIKAWKTKEWFIQNCNDCLSYKQKEIIDVKTKRVKKQKE